MLHNSQKDFLKRHIGPSDEDQNKMLKELNYKSLDDLIKSTVPEKIQLKDELNIPLLVREVVLDDVINLLEEWLEIDLSRYGTEIGSMMREYQQPVDEQS